MFKILRFMHDRKYVHRDIKPSNFTVGQGEYQDNVYIIDYGLSKRYVDQNTGMHIPLKLKTNFLGNHRYCSLNVENGMNHARRDDCEAVFYLLVELVRGDLPWKNTLATHQVKKYKNEATSLDFSKGLPMQFSLLFQYIRSLSFDDRPDYSSMIEMLEAAKDNL